MPSAKGRACFVNSATVRRISIAPAENRPCRKHSYCPWEPAGGPCIRQTDFPVTAGAWQRSPLTLFEAAMGPQRRCDRVGIALSLLTLPIWFLGLASSRRPSSGVRRESEVTCGMEWSR
jgi:hypothetical protein